METGSLGISPLAPDLWPLTSAQDASRNRSVGFSMVTTVLGGTLLLSETLAPMTELRPMIVSPPKMVALA